MSYGYGNAGTVIGRQEIECVEHGKYVARLIRYGSRSTPVWDECPGCAEEHAKESHAALEDLVAKITKRGDA